MSELGKPSREEQIEAVARALWSHAAVHDMGHQVPYPYERLIDVTQEDLRAYAIAALDALAALPVERESETEERLREDLARERVTSPVERERPTRKG